MILEVRDVGRKTPMDGRLEVTEGTYRRLTMEGELRATVGEVTTSAHLEELPCTCGRGAGAVHVHRFVQADVFRSLEAGATCVLELTAPGTLTASRPHPLGA